LLGGGSGFPLHAPVQQALNVGNGPCKAAIDANRAQRPVLMAGPFSKRLWFAAKVKSGSVGIYGGAIFMHQCGVLCGDLHLDSLSLK
jgi:hypothetical protein